MAAHKKLGGKRHFPLGTGLPNLNPDDANKVPDSSVEPVAKSKSSTSLTAEDWYTGNERPN